MPPKKNRSCYRLKDGYSRLKDRSPDKTKEQYIYIEQSSSANSNTISTFGESPVAQYPVCCKYVNTKTSSRLVTNPRHSSISTAHPVPSLVLKVGVGLTDLTACAGGSALLMVQVPEGRSRESHMPNFLSSNNLKKGKHHEKHVLDASGVRVWPKEVEEAANT